jgi:sugar phosphate isomerase/epimerase
MIRSAVTISLVPQIKSGPWIYWENLEESVKKAAALSFDAVELFTASADAVDATHLKKLLKDQNIQLAAVGTGAGKVIHGLTLTDPDPAIRKKAISFISDMISFGGKFGAPAIIGSMQGNVPPGGDRDAVLGWLAEGLEFLEKKAESEGVILIYEPLNRYETNLLNTLETGSNFLDENGLINVKLLADLFHMNIEEVDLANSIRTYGNYIGHVHFADSNRRPIGLGHTAMEPIAEALMEIRYSGYVSAEAFPFPYPDAAAEHTIRSFQQFF